MHIPLVHVIVKQNFDIQSMLFNYNRKRINRSLLSQKYQIDKENKNPPRNKKKCNKTKTNVTFGSMKQIKLIICRFTKVFSLPDNPDTGVKQLHSTGLPTYG